MSKITVIVTGETGSGKSAIAGEIEIALKAIGVPVEWKDADREWWQKGNEYWIDLYKPEVTIIEENIPIVEAHPTEGGKSLAAYWQCSRCNGTVVHVGKPNFCPYCRDTNLNDMGLPRSGSPVEDKREPGR